MENFKLKKIPLCGFKPKNETYDPLKYNLCILCQKDTSEKLVLEVSKVGLFKYTELV